MVVSETARTDRGLMMLGLAEFFSSSGGSKVEEYTTTLLGKGDVDITRFRVGVDIRALTIRVFVSIAALPPSLVVGVEVMAAGADFVL